MFVYGKTRKAKWKRLGSNTFSMMFDYKNQSGYFPRKAERKQYSGHVFQYTKNYFFLIASID